jgi:uncharacterized OsmC-like protein
MLTYRVDAHRTDAHGSLALTKQAKIILDTDPAGRQDAFNPAEMLLASLAACMLKSIERAAPMLDFHLSAVEVVVTAERQDSPPLLTRIVYEIAIETTETDHRIDLLHTNVRKYGTILNTLRAAADLSGTMHRRSILAGTNVT